jgi:hypothetical protein
MKQIAKDLPNFPDDIILQWIGYFAESEGWPPPEPLKGRWLSLLSNRNLDYWKSLSWKLETFNPLSLPFTESSQLNIQQIIAFHSAGEENEYSKFMGEESVFRFHQVIQFLREEGGFPHPPILLKHSEKYEVIDGNHRISAYYLWESWKDMPPFQKEPLPVSVSKDIQFWVGCDNSQ